MALWSGRSFLLGSIKTYNMAATKTDGFRVCGLRVSGKFRIASWASAVPRVVWGLRFRVYTLSRCRF